MWSPYEIDVLLWHYCRFGAHEGQQIGAPAYLEAIAKMKHHGLLVDGDSEDHPYITTELGEALIKLWEDTPIPVIKYVDPRIPA